MKYHSILIILLLAISKNCESQEKLLKMNEEIKNLGSFIKYEILPANKVVSILIIDNKESFYQIVSRYNGVPQDSKDSNLSHDVDFNLKFPRYDFSGLTKFFQLENGLVCIDQSLSIKGNPYYVCESYDDYVLITKYLVIFKNEETNAPVVGCNLFNHTLIKEFLQSKKLTEEENFNLPQNSKLFKAENGYYVFLESVPKNGSQLLWSLYEKINDTEEVYHSLTIYESIDIMKWLGIIDLDE